MAIAHKKRARKAWPHLVKVARSKTVDRVNYGQLCAKLGLHHRSAQWFLGVIQTYCRRNGLPRLQAIAVNKRTRIPGAGYETSRTKKGHSAELKRVRNFKWPKQAPNFDT